MQSILIVDDLESIHEMLDAVVQPIGYATDFASNGEEALAKFREKRHQIVLTDINMEPINGLELLKELKEIDPSVIVIMMSGYANVDNALLSLKRGAFDFLTKPFKVDQLLAAINRAANLNQTRPEEAEESDNSTAIIGDSSVIQKLRKAIERVGLASAPVLLHGEIGTRKATIAAMLHKAHGSDEDTPFVVVDCNQAEHDQIVAELFGSDGSGGSKFDEAKGGTLFIREVDHMDKELQGQLSNLIRDSKNELRFICSSCTDLEQLVEKAEFDDSLYYRISTLSVAIPSLRERADDIPLISKYILRNHGMDNCEITERAKALLQGYRWPGNLTELREAIEAAAMQSEDGTIRADDLPEKIRDITSWPSLTDFLEAQSLEYRTRVLRACQGDTAKAAEILECLEEDLSSL